MDNGATMRGKTIIVTGVASGIGACAARLLKARGARVIGLDRNEPEVELDRFVAYDQSDERSIAHAVDACAGPVDVLCNVAGIPPTAAAERVLAVNFLGLRALTERAVGKLADGGLIINVSSMAGFFWQQNLPLVDALLALETIGDATSFCEEHRIVAAGMGPTSSYPLSKQAVTAWSIRNFDRWSDRGIRLNVVSPGPVDTPILKDFVATIGDLPREGFLGRLRHGAPDDIARVIAMLCSEDAAWLNGVNLPADGGLSAYLTNKSCASD